MTPLQKKNYGKVAIFGCLFFYAMYFAIGAEPELYPGTKIIYHKYCDDHRIICKYCVWWFIANGSAIACLIWALKGHYDINDPEQCPTHLKLEFCLVFMGNWILDLFDKINHPEQDCVSIKGHQIIYTLFCILFYFYRRKQKK